jgi:hypothetical protein
MAATGLSDTIKLASLARDDGGQCRDAHRRKDRIPLIVRAASAEYFPKSGSGRSSMTELLIVVHVIRLPLGLGAATAKAVLLLRCAADSELIASYLR